MFIAFSGRQPHGLVVRGADFLSLDPSLKPPIEFKPHSGYMHESQFRLEIFHLTPPSPNRPSPTLPIPPSQILNNLALRQSNPNKKNSERYVVSLFCLGLIKGNDSKWEPIRIPVRNFSCSLFSDRNALSCKLSPSTNYALNNLFRYLQMSLATRKPVFGVCDQGRLKLACSASRAR